MDNLKAPYRYVHSVTFEVYSTEEIEKLSVLEVTNPATFDSLGHPTSRGLYDPLLGPNERDECCGSCGLNSMQCPGHIGHIKLPFIVFNPVFIRTAFILLQGSCLQCHRLISHPTAVNLVLAQMKALKHGLLSTAYELEDVVTKYENQMGGVKTIVEGLKEALDKYLEDALQGQDNAGLQECFPVKNVMDFKKRIIKEFTKNHLTKTVKKCPRCNASKPRLSLRNNCEIISNRRIRSAPILPKAQKIVPKVEYDEYGELVVAQENASEEPVELTDSNISYLSPVDARKHFHLLWENESAILKEIFGGLSLRQRDSSSPMDMFFMDNLPVPPSRFRPISYMNGRKYDNPHTVALSSVLLVCIAMRHLQQSIAKQENLEDQTSTQPVNSSVKHLIFKAYGTTPLQKLHSLWVTLQTKVNCVYDCEMDKQPIGPSVPGLKQILEKKEGLFRKNMMGKRVDFAARSVISPDPYIMANEIGVPTVFATKLTFPQPVTPWNVQQLRQAVINGPNVHPGAVLVSDERGTIMHLRSDDRVQREAIAKELLTPSQSYGQALPVPKIVHRHIKNGDVLLMNRQPTLHKPSIMAHKVRVLPREKTLRLHYVNCKCYNADFDGDEMNAHCPQSELARSEAYNIASVNFQYLVPKDGTPLSGLIQDHIISSTVLTLRGTFFSREDYQQLVFSALTFVLKPLKLLPPAMLKPVLQWSGKQVMSTILINLIPEGKPPLFLEGKSKVSFKDWQTLPPRPWIAGGTPLIENHMSESEVIIRNGELLCGVLDKAHFGPTPYGLVHLCYELYGGEMSTLLLTAVARVCLHFLQIHEGFSLGVEDIMVSHKANKKRDRVLKTASLIGDAAVAEALGVENSDDKDLLKDRFQDSHLSSDDKYLKQVDNVVKSQIDSLNNEINKICMPLGLVKKFPHNNLQLMVKAGAKGSQVNCMQISCLLGQIELEGRRVPMMLSGKTLPSFPAYDTSPRAGGFVSGRFFSGIRPQEYFFHCMAGREGLVDTAVKTSRSGYLQRCLIKHLEGLVVNYDLTVRDSDGSVIQFLYGEDGLDILKSQMLKSDQFAVLAENHKTVVTDKHLEEAKDRTHNDSIYRHKKNIRKWKKTHGNPTKRRKSPFTLFSGEQFLTGNSSVNSKEELCNMWHSMDKKVKKQYIKQCQVCPDTVNSQFCPNVVFGSVSEKLENLIEDYVQNNPQKLLVQSEEELDSKKYVFKQPVLSSKFQDLIYFMSMKAICDPGEAVGLLAAQSIGEPSTQMTLNTFHFAGKGEMNVTLGIPRLREILMVASANIKTPSMDLPLLPHPDIDKQAERLRLQFTKVCLTDVTESVTVKEVLKVAGSERFRNYEILFQFCPYKSYKRKFRVTPSTILKYMEYVFFKKLNNAIKQKLVTMSQVKIVNMASTTVRSFKESVRNEEKEDEPAVLQNETSKPLEEDNESSGPEEMGEGDTTSTKERTRRDQELEYEEPEEEEKDVVVSDTEVVEEVENPQQEASETTENEANDNEETVIKEGKKKKKSKLKQMQLEDEKPKRINTVLNMMGNMWIVDYDFDTLKEEWCKVTFQMDLGMGKLDMQSLVMETASSAVVHETPKISRAFIVKDTKSSDGSAKILKTEGVNFQEIFKYDAYFDMNRLYCNDIHAIAKTYGIEAATRAIVREATNVFAVYGITVDPRHLLLIADYMTFDGQYKACNRYGMDNNCSPIQQMTFETTMNFMKTATLLGSEDYLTSPSARIVLGRVVRSGTGCFDLKQPRVTIK